MPTQASSIKLARAKSSHQLLKAYFVRKKETSPSFSARLLARKMDLSPTFVNKMLRGTKPIPIGRVGQFGALLDIDSYGVRRIQRAIYAEQGLGDDLNENLQLTLSSEEPMALPSEEYAVSSRQKYSVMDQWYYLPILDLVDCVDFRAEAEWISIRLGLRLEVAENAWKHLIALGLVEEKKEKWQKVDEKVVFPTSRIDPSIQKFHFAMLQKADYELRYHREPADYDRRFFMGATVSTSEAAVGKAQKQLEETLCKVGNDLSAGPNDRVYYLAMQLFPLTKEGKRRK